MRNICEINSIFVCESSYVWINMKKERFSCEFLTFEGRNLDISDTYSSLFLILRRISTSYLCHCGSYVWEVGQAVESEKLLLHIYYNESRNQESNKVKIKTKDIKFYKLAKVVVIVVVKNGITSLFLIRDSLKVWWRSFSSDKLIKKRILWHKRNSTSSSLYFLRSRKYTTLNHQKEWSIPSVFNLKQEKSK